MAKHEMGTCPVCTGTMRMPVPAANRRYAEQYGWWEYSKEDDCITCGNCGGQYQFGKPTGKVHLRPDMSPCVHTYVGANIGRCLTRHTCTHCGDTYDIDSSD